MIDELIANCNLKTREFTCKILLRLLRTEFEEANKLLENPTEIIPYANKIDTILDDYYNKLKNLFENGSKYEIKEDK